MKPAPFIYHRPKTVDDAVAMLAEVAPLDGRIIAGGQTLVPMMALRVAYPTHLVDINGLTELDRVHVEDDRLVIGALARHARFERPVEDGPTGRILAYVAHHIAHLPIRSRGTFCGSLANSDPASEWCLTAATLEAELVAAGPEGRRTIPVEAFFEDIMTTALAPDELLVEVRLKLLAPDTRVGFYEFSRRAGDFALGMCLATYRLEEGRITTPHIGIGGAETHPRRIQEAEAELMGQAPTPETIARAAKAAMAVVDPMEDTIADAEYRRGLVGTAITRALGLAAAGTILQ